MKILKGRFTGWYADLGTHQYEPCF